MVSMDHFRQEIRSRFELASAQGRQDLTIECGELYRSMSALPLFDPWMIFCCNAMRAEMALTDHLIFDDGKPSLLTIHYALPRHQKTAKSKPGEALAPMTGLSLLLVRNGLPDLPVVLIEPHRNFGTIWRIRFNYDIHEPLSMSAGQASSLATELHQIGADELAGEIDDAVRSAARYSAI